MLFSTLLALLTLVHASTASVNEYAQKYLEDAKVKILALSPDHARKLDAQECHDQVAVLEALFAAFTDPNAADYEDMTPAIELMKCLCSSGFTGTSSSSASVDQLCKCQDAYLAVPDMPQEALDAMEDACGDSDSDPCFARDTLAISPDGALVPMAALKSGDLVMDGPNSVARVIVNQHREAIVKSSLLELTHADGELSLTPDHVLEIDGAFVPARMASAGSKLGESEVSRVTAKAGEVINPLTTSGKILTQGGVLASTYPEWIAEYMLSSCLVPLPLSLSNLLSYCFPETTQAYYDALIEPLVTKAHPKHLKAALPASLVPAAFLAGDLAVSAGFFGFALASPMMLVAAAVVAMAAKARK